MAQQRKRRDHQKKRDQGKQREYFKQHAESQEDAKVIQQVGEKRSRITPMSCLLCLFLMVLLPVMLHRLLMYRIEARSEARLAAMQPVIDTTATIESVSLEIRMWALGRDRSVPSRLSELRRDLIDAWGNPLRIVHEGDPMSSYLISSAGNDSAFDTDDDIAIRFSINHEPIERINAYGLEELEAGLTTLPYTGDGGR